MKKNYILLLTILMSTLSFAQELVITGAYDGPLSGGTPKGIELFVLSDIADLSIYGIGSANNGGGSDGEEFTFPAVAASAGTYIYIASEAPQFEAFFGFAPDYTSGSMGINGDDAIELFKNGTVTDVFGDINTDGSGEGWDYLDSWAYRVDNTGPDGSSFDLSNWTFGGANSYDGETTNATSATPMPIGTYQNNTLSIANVTATDFSVYPNPVTNGTVNIKSNNNQAIQVSVYDVLGKQVLAKNLTNQTLNVSSLHAGMYILKLEQNGDVSTKKLVIK